MVKVRVTGNGEWTLTSISIRLAQRQKACVNNLVVESVLKKTSVVILVPAAAFGIVSSDGYWRHT